MAWINLPADDFIAQTTWLALAAYTASETSSFLAVTDAPVSSRDSKGQTMQRLSEYYPKGLVEVPREEQ